MRKLLLITLTLLLIIPGLKAAEVKGIQVESLNFPILVYVDGTQVCSPVYSCFVTNLSSGSYRVEVYKAGSRERVYSENIYYNGFGIEKVAITGGNSNIEDRPHNNNRPRNSRVMNEVDFNKFYNSITSAVFDSDKNAVIDLGLASSDFTTTQIARIVSLYTFDKDKLPLLKKFYRNTADKANYFSLLEKLDFISSKNELKEFIEKYNN